MKASAHLKRKLERLRKVERRKYHPLIHKIHKTHRISKKTLFYLKEYGPHSNVPRTIIKESLKILLLTAVISSIGGIALDQVKEIFTSIIPLIILLPGFNDMIGDYGTVVSSRFSAMLHEGRIKGGNMFMGLFKNDEIKRLFAHVIIISMITGLFSLAAALIISGFSNYRVSALVAYKLLAIVVLDIVLLMILIFAVSISAGIYFYNKNEEPNNFLIPITTAFADFGNMLFLAVLVALFF